MACCFAWFTCLEGCSMFQANLLMFSTVSGEFDLEHCLQHSCFTYLYLFFTAFFGCSKPIHSRFRSPWRVEAKSSSAWTALKYRSRSGLWPWSLREPRSWCAFQMHFGSRWWSWCWIGRATAPKDPKCRPWLGDPCGALRGSRPILHISCRAAVDSERRCEASECHQKRDGSDVHRISLGPLACLIVNFVDLFRWHRYNMIQHRGADLWIVVSRGVFVEDRFFPGQVLDGTVSETSWCLCCPGSFFHRCAAQ